MINNFPKLDNTDADGYISQNNIFTIITIIIKTLKILILFLIN